ncbi:MAG TPA: hypothetical protein QGF05_11920 [Dehalococcoidia bacterium]|nr:hypothetical protein [Dehalococcoidia bacterium]
MAQREKKKKRDRQTQIAILTRPDQDTLYLRTFWSPLPSWIYGTVGAAVVAGAAALIGAGSGASGSDIQTMALIGGLIGYFGAALSWAVVGIAGGDLQEVTFHRREDVAHVHQSLLWIWRRNWSFEMDEAFRLHVWQKRGGLIFKLSQHEIVDLTFTDDADSARLPNLNLGRYPTEMEGMAIAKQLADFLQLPINREKPES